MSDFYGSYADLAASEREGVRLQAFLRRITGPEELGIEKRHAQPNRIYFIRDLDHWDEDPDLRPKKPIDPLFGYKFPVDTVLPFPVARSLDAAMAGAVKQYVDKKLPLGPIGEALAQSKPIFVLGCYAPHLEANPAAFDYEQVKQVQFAPPHKAIRTKKRFNLYRPKFYWCTRKSGEIEFVCAVFPGRDYVLQYASLMRHTAYDLTVGAMRNFHIIRYPHLEATLCSWTKLDEKFINPGDTIILGYVDELSSYLKGNEKFRYIRE